MSTTEGYVRRENPIPGPKVPGGELTLAGPAELPKPVPPNMLQIIFPVVMVVAMVGMIIMMFAAGSSAGGGSAITSRLSNPLYLMFPLMMLASMAGIMMNSGGGGKQIAEINEDRLDYFRYLNRQRSAVHKIGREHSEARHWTHPDPAVLESLIPLQASLGDRMWERKNDSPDFLKIRVGLGRERLATKLVAPETAPLSDLEPVGTVALKRFVAAHKVQSGIPLALRLSTFPIVSISDDEHGVASRAFTYSVLMQLMTFHGPDHVKIALITNDPDSENWAWMKWLPHAQHPTMTDQAGTARMMYRSVGDAREALSAMIGTTKHSETATLPNHLIIINDLRPGVVEGADGEPGQVVSVSDLIGKEGRAGVTVIDLQPGLPGTSPVTKDLSVRIENGVLFLPNNEGKLTEFARADAVSVRSAAALARKISRYRVTGSIEAIESQIVHTVVKEGFLEHYGIDDPAAYDPAKFQRTYRREEEHSEFLAPIIGKNIDGTPMVLNIKEMQEGGTGPHGLSIGATGSGKSEFLRTLVLALITSHSSEVLNLLLVDFKGGAAFLGFEGVPHVTEILTNMAEEEHLVDRLKVVLRGEMNRRQTLFREAVQYIPEGQPKTVPNILVYNRIAYRRDNPLTPLPALFVVVDEFTELLTQHPDFAELFVQIGRLGRSMGIYEHLSSQTVDQGKMRGLETHLSYAIALKTFDAAQSMAVIGTREANELPAEPGSLYLKNSANELSRGKAFYIDEPYIPRRPGARRHHGPAASADDRPEPRLFTAAPVMGDAKPVAQHAVVPGDSVQAKKEIKGRPFSPILLERMANQGKPAYVIWLKPLDFNYTFGTLLNEIAGAQRPDSRFHWPEARSLKVPIGVVDNPYWQRRDAFTVDFDGAGGNMLFVGGPQSGKSTALQTLIVSTAHQHLSTQIQFYCLDFSAGKLMALSDLAHVGMVATRNDDEEVSRTIAEMTALRRRRELLFKKLRIDSMADFRMRKERNDPALAEDKHGDAVLVIDGWNVLKTEFEQHVDAIQALAEGGLSYGIHVVVAARRFGDVAPKMKDQLVTKVELKLADSMESEVSRQAADAVPKDMPGRGTLLSGRKGDGEFAPPEALHFLIALPSATDTGDGARLSARAITDVKPTIALINTKNPVPAPPVPLLPTKMDRAVFLAAAKHFPGKPTPTAGRRANLVVPLGVGELELAPQYIDFNNDTQTHMVVYSDPDCGKTTALRHVIKTLTEQNSPDDIRLVVADYRRELLGTLPQEFGQYVSTPKDLTQIILATREGLQSRLPRADVTPKELRERSWWDGPDLIFIVDDIEQVLRNGDPFLPIIEMLPQGRDLGFHFIAAHRTNGVGRAQFGNNVIAELTRSNAPGILMSGPKEEGAVLGGLKPSPQPPGRGYLVIGNDKQLIQMPNVEPDL